jgi:hypothetical protein
MNITTRSLEHSKVKMLYGNIPIVDINDPTILREPPKPIINDIETSIKNIISTPYKPSKQDWEIINDWVKFGKPITRLVLIKDPSKASQKDSLGPIFPKRSSKIYNIENKSYVKYPCVSSMITELYELLTEKN